MNYAINVNGRVNEVESEQLSYEDVVQLAFEPGDLFSRPYAFTVAYKGVAGPKTQGTLIAGESVKLKDGAVFNVARTDGA